MTKEAVHKYALMVGSNVFGETAGNLIATIYDLQRQWEEYRDDGFHTGFEGAYGMLLAPHGFEFHANQFWGGTTYADGWNVVNANGAFVARFRTQGAAEYAAMVCDMLAVREKPTLRLAHSVDLRIVFDDDSDEEAGANLSGAVRALPQVIGTYIINDDARRVGFDPALLEADGKLEWSYIESSDHVKEMEGR
jgi:hypothetical protein